MSTTHIYNCRLALGSYKWATEATEGNQIEKIQKIHRMLQSAVRCLSQTPQYLPPILNHFYEEIEIAIGSNIIFLEKEKAKQLASKFPEHAGTFSEIAQNFTRIETEIEARNLSKNELLERREQIEKQIIALQSSALKVVRVASPPRFIRCHGLTFNPKYQVINEDQEMPNPSLPIWLHLEDQTQSLFEVPDVYSETFPAPSHLYWEREGSNRIIKPLFDANGKQAFVLAEYVTKSAVSRGEIEISHCLARAPSPNLVCETLATTKDDKLTMIAPYWEKDLMTFLEDDNIHLSSNQKIFICKKVAQAVVDLHARKGFHGDIKPENILCNNELSAIALTDFGFSGVERDSPIPYKQGTSEYGAPELYGNDVFKKSQIQKTDCYSLGATIFMTCTRQFLNDRNSSIYYRLTNPRSQSPYDAAQKAFDRFWTEKNRPKPTWYRHHPANEKLIQLSYLLTQIDPNKRPSAEQTVEIIHQIEAQRDFNLVLDELTKKKNKFVSI